MPITSSAISVERLTDAIRSSWDGRTSADQKLWTPERPSYGQCAVTALVVQDHLGGTLLRANVGSVSHYWNDLRDGELDLTRDQFDVFDPVDIAHRDRDYVLSFEATRWRYNELMLRVQQRVA